MAEELGHAAARLYEGVMAPLVLGGPLRVGAALGARVALALGAPGREGRVDPSLLERVQARRVARARELAPVDELPGPAAADWALFAALHDVVFATNPAFDGPLRRAAPARVLDLALATLDRVEPPRRVADALARHAWLARILDVVRTDTEISWWTGSRVFRGEAVPARLRRWPELRRVTETVTRRSLFELEPLGVSRQKVVEAVARLIARSPLTDLATCTRAAPAFTWSDGALALAATRAGRTLALRALASLPRADVDAALEGAAAHLEARRAGLASNLIDALRVASVPRAS